MKIYFVSRSAARSMKANAVNPDALKVVDSKAVPSVKGSRWAVESKRV